MRFIVVLMAGWCGVTLATAATTDLAATYARYASEGRSDAEVHLSPSGAFASAQLWPSGDGGFVCRVSGLKPRLPDGAAARLQLAGMLLHELTHCLVEPQLAALRRDGNPPLLALISESIADAHAVLEVSRRDGPANAEALVEMMLPARRRAAGTAHGTAGVLTAALRWAAQSAPMSGRESLQAALCLGRDHALASTANSAASDRHALAHELDAAFGRILRAFEQGRYANSAVTLRSSNEGVSAADRHLYVERDGTVREVPAISAEGAHGFGQLRQMLDGADAAPEQALAASWLLNEGRLEPQALMRSRSTIGRFLRTMSAADPAVAGLAQRVLSELIQERRRGADLSMLLDDAASRIQAARALP